VNLAAGKVPNVRYLAEEAGITQFLDLGSGLPGVGNVHEIAPDVNPAARVVYVDNDPIVLAHGRALLNRADLHRNPSPMTGISSRARRPGPQCTVHSPRGLGW
jgi:hypothetical protein